MTPVNSWHSYFTSLTMDSTVQNTFSLLPCSNLTRRKPLFLSLYFFPLIALPHTNTETDECSVKVKSTRTRPGPGLVFGPGNHTNIGCCRICSSAITLPCVYELCRNYHRANCEQATQICTVQYSMHLARAQTRSQMSSPVSYLHSLSRNLSRRC